MLPDWLRQRRRRVPCPRLCVGMIASLCMATQSRGHGTRRSALPRKLNLEPLEDRTLPSVLALVGGTLRYAETSGSSHNITVSYRAGTPGTYTITDNENFTSLPAGWSGVGTLTAVGPDTGVAAGQITTGAGDDTINIRSTGVAFSVNSGAGNDTFNITSGILPRGDGTFKPQATFAGGGGPHAVAVGDFNGDAKPDLAVANYTTNTIGIHLGNGDGSLKPQVTFATVERPWQVAVGDFNGDGKLDLTVVNYVNGSLLSVLLGNGNGTFQPQATSTIPGSPIFVAVSDLNGDGKSDLAVANFNGNSISVLRGNGNGTFESPQSFLAGPLPAGVAVGDFNADGKFDLATPHSGASSIGVLLANGNGTFLTQATFPASGTTRIIAAGDFNADGNLDLVTPNPGGGVINVLLGNGNGTFQSFRTFPAGPSSFYVAVADFNADGKLDFIAENDGSNSVSILLGNGNGTFLPQVTYAAGNSPNSLVVADLNGDGAADLAVANFQSNSVSVLLGNTTGGGLFGPQATFATGAGPRGAAVGDFNGDGNTDLAVANRNSNTVSVLLANGNGTFAAQATFATGSFPLRVAVADFNGDGKLDLAVTNYGGATVSVLLGNGNGAFAPQATFAAGSSPVGVALADFNGDSKLDLAVANYGASTVSVLLGNGNATFAPRASFATATKPNPVAVGDFNGDGKSDLAVANFGSNTLSVLLGNGNGAFASQATFATGSMPISVVVGDFNGDGKADVAVTNYGAGTVTVLLGNGNGAFAPQATFGIGSAPYLMAAGDLNGDGKTDLVIPNFNNNTVSVLLGNGNGTFAPQTTNATGGGPFSVALGDFNVDGVLDLAVANNGASTVSVLLANPFKLSGLADTLTLDGGAGSNRLLIKEDNGGAGDAIQITSTLITSSVVPFTINYQATGGDFKGGISIVTPNAGNSTLDLGNAPANFTFSAGAGGTATVKGEGTVNIGGVTFGAGSAFKVSISQATSTQLNASGAVSLTGSALSVDLANGFIPALSQQYTIVQAAGGLTGVFNNLPEAAQVFSGNVTFQIHYTSTVVTLTVTGVPPTISGFSPPSGKATEPVVIIGTNFTADSAVTIGGITVTFTLDSITQITATISNAARTGVIRVVTGGGTATSATNFNVIPTVTGFTPSSGVAGTNVTISGANFTGATAVTFGGANATSFTVNSATQIVAGVPGNAVSGPIAVTTPGGTGTSANNFTITVATPTITGFNPTSGPVGTTVTITGTNFTGASAVIFGGVNATNFTVDSATQITATVPNNAASGVVSVTTPGGTATSGSFTIAAPTITGFAPSSGPVGTMVTLTGTNLLGASAVKFNGFNAASFTVDSATQITATVPNNATSGTISVTTPGGTATSAGSFTVTAPAPTITNIAPASGPVGTNVTVTGTNLLGATAVQINGMAAPNFSVDSATQITVVVPAGATSGPIAVTTAGGTATSASSFTVTIVNPGVATHFTFIAPSTITAGVPFNFTVFARDANEIVATGYSGTVHFDSNDPQATVPADAMITGGSGMFSATLRSAQDNSHFGIGATDTLNPIITGSYGFFRINPGPVSTFKFDTIPATATVGTQFNIAVSARDAFDNITTGYTGSVHFTSTDSQATLPADSPLTNGVSLFNVTLKTTGLRMLGARDTANPNINGNSAGINVQAAPPPVINSFTPQSGSVNANVTITGQNFTTAVEVDFNGIPCPPGTFTIDSDTQIRAKVPVGAGTGPITIITPGGSVSSTTNFTVTNTPPTITSAANTTFTVGSLGSFNVTATGLPTPVISISGGVLPSGVAFTFDSQTGIGTLNGTPDAGTAGDYQITFRAANNVVPDATQNFVLKVNPAPATQLVLVNVPASVITGVPFAVKVRAVDATNNPATGYRGTVHFATTDAGSGAIMPPDYTFVAADNGEHTFNLTLATLASQTVSVTDTSAGSLTAAAVISVVPRPTTRTWTGRALDNKWSSAGNWQEGIIPDPGNALVFPDGAFTLQPTNDISGAIVYQSIRFAGSVGGYDLFGLPIGISGSVTNAGGVNIIDATITGPGSVVTEAGILTLDGNNSFTGTATLNANSNLALTNDNSLGLASTTTVLSASPNNGGSLQIFNNLTITQPLVINGTGNSNPNSAGAIHIAAQNGSFDDVFSSITLGSNSTLFSEPGITSVTFDGLVQTNGHDFTILGVTLVVLTGRTNVLGGGALVIASSTTLTVSGTGETNVGADVNFSGNANFRANLSGDSASLLSSHGAVTIGSNANLNFSVDSSFNPPPDKSFVLLQSSGTLTGQFQNRPEGSTVTLNGHRFVVRYIVASGNNLEVSSQVLLVSQDVIAGNGFLIPPGTNVFVTGADAGGGPDVRVFNAASHAQLAFFFAYNSNFTGGVRVAVGDVNGDDFLDVITAAGPGGGPDVAVFSGNGGAQLFNFYAFNPLFTGGVTLAVGDTNNDGFADIICGADGGGGPNITVYSGKDNATTLLTSFYAYNESFTGGVRVASADVNGDSFADVICGAGPGGGPNVTVYSGQDNAQTRLFSFFAFADTFTNGIYVAGGDTDGDGRAEVFAGPGRGGGPNVAIFNGLDARMLSSFFVVDPAFFGGIRVGAAVQPSGRAYLVAVEGPQRDPQNGALSNSAVNIFEPLSASPVDSFFALNPAFTGGLYVAGNSSPGAVKQPDTGDNRENRGQPTVELAGVCSVCSGSIFCSRQENIRHAKGASGTMIGRRCLPFSQEECPCCPSGRANGGAPHV